ncbi:Uncharacterised protein [Klebsiella pneumoniae]|nr:Uncharacterised protein [Klebsiella pneumoniae]
MNFAIGHVGKHVLEFRFLLTSQFNFTEFALTIQCHFTRFLLVTHNGHFVTSSRNAGQTQDFHWNGRTCFQHFLTQFVTHRTNATVFETAQNDITFMQCTFTNQNGSNRATSFIQEGFDNRTARHTVTDGFQLQNFGLQQDRVQQFVDTGTRFRRHVYELAFAAPLFRQDTVLGKFVFNTIGIRFWLIDLVHCNHNRHTRCFRVLDSFDGLRHDAVVCSNNQNNDIRRLSTTSTHGGKRGVAWGIQEGDHTVVSFYVVCTDVLGNTTRFARSNLGRANVVKQRGFTVVNVTHDGHYRCARFCRSTCVTVAHYCFFQLVFTTQDNFVAHLFRNQLRSFLIDHLVDGCHRAQLHHCFDDLRAFNRHLVRQFANGNGFADHNVTVNGLSRLLEALLQSGTFTLAAFTTANSRTCFFTVSFGFRVLVTFFRRTRCFCITTTATAAFYFTVVIIFSLTCVLRSGHVIVAGVFRLLSGINTVLLIFFCHATRFFGDAASFFFQLTAGFFFRFTLQLGSFIFTAGFFSLGSFGHFVCLLIAHFVFFRSVTLHFITCVAFRFFCGLTFSF